MAVPQINEHESAGTVGEPAAPASKAASNGHPAGESARPEIPEAADLVAMLDMLLPGGTVGALHRFRPDASTLRCAVRLALRPDALARRTTTLASELAKVAAGTSTIAPARRDRRFADPAWSENPMLKRAVLGYLAISQAAEGLLEDAGLDWRDNERVKFILINLIAAAAPSNNPLLSPVAWKAVIDTGGLSIVRGLRALISDMSSSPHVPTMVEPDAFTVGKDIAVSPGAVVARTDVYELIQYEPTTPTVYRFPILMVPPMINKYYITDLAPGRSMLEFFVAQGYQVFVISWRNPGKEFSHWNVNTYGSAVTDSLATVRSITKAPKVNLGGLCAGGITSSMVSAHLAATGHLDEISTLFLGVTLLDQSQAGTTVAIMDAPIAAASVMSSRVRGYMDGKTLAEVFAWLRPDDLIWNYWVNNYLQGKPPPPFDILYWNADTTRMPAGLHRDFIKLAQANALTKAGVASMLGSPVDLSKVDVDTYVVGGVDDHIAPWKMAYRATQLLGGNIKFVLSTSGHVASMVNPPSNPKATFRIGPGNPPDPEEWLAHAETEHGSWWPDYTAWLADRSGGQKPRPRALGSSKYPPLMPAPGTYILQT
ncbi:MAG: PHA/PHB synthase family protein [Streptosporangiaceae bacterium]|jgi:class II poly(R)-hydroxyalkanoic acid synthase|nr:poly(3-hydroxyalkanoate) polymerase [Actinomycetota bacterium]